MSIVRISAMLMLFILSVQHLPPARKFIDPSNMDTSVKPGDNFYLYANGNWIRKNPVPPSKNRWGSFDELFEESRNKLRTLLGEAAANAARNPAQQRIGDFFASAMDSATIEKRGYEPVKGDLERISRITTIPGVIDEIIAQHTKGINSSVFGFGVDQDLKDVNRNIPQFEQSGILLPDRDYYFNNDGRSVTIRNAYVPHIRNMFILTGTDSTDAARNAAVVMKIETALAAKHLTRVELRDPQKTYNKFSVPDLTKTTPSLEWQSIIKKLGITSSVDSVLVDNPPFLKTVDSLFAAIPADEWKPYLSWHVLKNAAPFLDSGFVNENFSFARVLTGQKEQTPRWQRASNMIDRALGDELGKVYVAKYFRPEAKKRMLELVNNLQVTFGDRIRRLDWMSEETKKRALEKLATFTKKIAYPDKWKNYSGLTIKRNDFFSNVRNTAEWNYKDMISRYGKPVDKSRWIMSPPTINAYYNPTNNEIVFPAGILQFPFFDNEADDAVNYGAIGGAIGHEMTHGFDDQGRQFAADGNLRDWWTEEDAKKFKEKADKVVEQYGVLTLQDSLRVNGKLTLGENIADLGALAIAYEAFKKTKQFKDGKKIDGFTPTQRFFLSWGQVWRSNIRPETEAQYIMIDPHSPPMYRVNVPLSNLDEWYEAFNVKEGDKLFRPADQRIKVW